MKQTLRIMLLGGLAAALAAALASAIPASAQQASLHGRGLVEATPEQCAAYPHALISRDANRPSRVILDDYLPAVGDQGRTGSCVGWSTAYYCYTYAVNKERQNPPDERNDPQWQFSPAFIWHQFNNGQSDQGMLISQAFDTLNTQGCATYKEMPWDEGDVSSQPSDAAKARAKLYTARKTVNLVTPGQMVDPEVLKTWFAEAKEPVVIGIKVFQDFMSAPHDPDFVYAAPSEDDPGNPMVGGHGICLIGYDDSKRAFRMINSWGPGWGNNGQLWLSEDYVVRYTREAWGQEPGGPVAKDATGTHFLDAPDIVATSSAPPHHDLRPR